MSALGRKLRKGADDALSFWCPGCDEAHTIRIGTGPRPRWTFDGNTEQPTFSPSVLVTSGHYTPQFKQGDECWCTYDAEHPDEKPTFGCGRCHTFVRGGRIEFLSDCTHKLAGKTVDLPDWPHAG